MSSYVSEKEELEDNRIDLIRILDDMLRGVGKMWLLLLVIVVVCTGAMYYRAKSSYVPYYSSAATFTVSTVTDSVYDTSSYYNSVTASQMAKTFPYILTSGLLNKTVAEDLGVKTIPGNITAESVAGTNLFTIVVTAQEPQMAYDILQSVIENYPVVAEYVIGKTSMELLDMTGVAQEAANPPAFRSSALKGTILGCAVCAVLVFAYAITRRTVRTSDDLKRLLNVECICSVPQINFKKRSRKVYRNLTIYNEKISQSFVEAIRVLRVRIEREARKGDRKTILVTSAIPSEGKSTIAINTAMALALNGRKVAMVDCDLRGPSVMHALGLEDEGLAGLSDYLTGKKSLPKVLHYMKEFNLYVIPGGTCCSQCYDSADSPEMGKLIQELKEVVDYIVLDTAPVGMFADTAVLADNVDMAVFVVRQDHARREEIMDGIAQLADGGVYVAGCVLNGVTAGIGGYGYRAYNYYSKYGYSRYHSSQSSDESQ